MTTIAIVVGSVFAYVVVAGRVYRWLREARRWWLSKDYYAASALWPFVVGVWFLVYRPLVFAWNLGSRCRSKLPEARVRR